jgi:putative FmdB family regulatory protein
LPLYEYECQKCHKVTEKIEKVDGPHLKKCPHCGGKVDLKVSRSAIQFKGAGWYVTDYAGKKPPADATSGNNSASDKSDSKDSSSKESKDSKDSKESKPATSEKKTEKKKS